MPSNPPPAPKPLTTCGDPPGSRRARITSGWFGVAEQAASDDGAAPASGAGLALGDAGATIEPVTAVRSSIPDLVESEARLAEENARLAEENARLAEENARLRAESDRAARQREEFASIASHELNTPITSLQLNLQGLERALLRGDDVPAEVLVARLRLAGEQVEQLAGLVDMLLHVSVIRPDPTDEVVETIDLADVVDYVVARRSRAIARSGSTIDVWCDRPATGAWDRERLEQIVTPLVGNALKYGAGKPIEIRVEAEPDVVRLSLRDRGIGIAADDLERIFERFERAVSGRHVSGFGLGLWMVRRNVHACGGVVRVTSRLGEGSTFVVELPRTPPSTRRSTPP